MVNHAAGRMCISNSASWSFRTERAFFARSCSRSKGNTNMMILNDCAS